MKHFKRFFILVLCVLPWVAGANVATTAGSNLTAWNGNGGSANNNTWNTMMNSRSQTGSTAKADFGNCNSLILRCAQPKCAACTTMELAKPVEITPVSRLTGSVDGQQIFNFVVK